MICRLAASIFRPALSDTDNPGLQPQTDESAARESVALTISWLTRAQTPKPFRAMAIPAIPPAASASVVPREIALNRSSRVSKPRGTASNALSTTTGASARKTGSRSGVATRAAITGADNHSASASIEPRSTEKKKAVSVSVRPADSN